MKIVRVNSETAYRCLMFLCIFPTNFFSKESVNNTIFSKKINFEVIFFLFNTDETQTLILIFHRFYMLIEYFMLVFMIPVNS